MSKIIGLIALGTALGYFVSMPHITNDSSLYFSFGVRVVLATVGGLFMLVCDYTIPSQAPKKTKKQMSGSMLFGLLLIAAVSVQMLDAISRVPTVDNPGKHSVGIMFNEMINILDEKVLELEND